MPLLQKLGELAKEVCYFSSHRIVSSYGFARVVQGCLTRLYGYSGEQGHVYANIGERTEAEKNLSLNFSTNDSELFAEGFDEIDEEHIIVIHRTIDKNLIELNSQGFINGHTPFSSMLAWPINTAIRFPPS